MNAIIEKINIPFAKSNKKNVDNISKYISNKRNVDVNKIVPKKYELTDLGVKELEENEYIVYMHSHQDKDQYIDKNNKFDV